MSSSALLPELLAEEKLTKAMSMRGGLDALSMIIGPILGGVIYGLIGINVVFGLNAASFIISGITAMLMLYVSKTQQNKKVTAASFFKENGEVLFFIKSSKGLMQLFCFIMGINLFLAPLITIVIPYAMKKGIGFTSSQYGYMMAAFTVGILIGNIVLGACLKTWGSEKLIKTANISQMVMFFALTGATFPNFVKTMGGHSWRLFAVFVFVITLIGIFNAAINTPLMVNLQKNGA